MAQTAVSFGSITITDFTDLKPFTCQLTANQPSTVLYDPDQNIYTPNWGTTATNLVVTPVIRYGATILTNTDSALSITYTRKEDSGTATALTTGEAKQSNGTLKVTANKFSSKSITQITYIATVSYTEPESNQTLTGECTISFTFIARPTNAKTCSIEGDTVFKYGSDGAIMGATSITMTAILSNVSVVKWQYLKEDGTWGDISSSASTTRTVSHSALFFINDKATFKVVTSDDSVYDTHTIVKLRDGAPGNSTVAAVLTNEDQMIPCNQSGTPTSYDGAQAQLIIYRGSTAETDNWTLTGKATGCKVKFSTDGETWSDTSYGSSSGSDTNSTVTKPYVKVVEMLADTATFLFKASKTGETTLQKTFSLIKMKTGADGTSPTIYMLECSALAVNVNEGATTLTPSSVTIKGWKKTGDSDWSAYSGRFKVTVGGTTTNIYTSSSNESSKSLTSTQMKNALSSGYMTVQLCLAGGTSTVLDTQTIVFTSDGETGATGPQGDPGVDAINVVLGNQADVIPCTKDNKASAAVTVSIPFVGYKGTTQVACTVATPSNLFGISPPVTNATTSANGSIVYSIPSGTSVSSSTGTITLTFPVKVRKSSTFTGGRDRQPPQMQSSFRCCLPVGISSRTGRVP